MENLKEWIEFQPKQLFVVTDEHGNVIKQPKTTGKYKIEGKICTVVFSTKTESRLTTTLP